jgi:hypothetical protein
MGRIHSHIGLLQAIPDWKKFAGGCVLFPRREFLLPARAAAP